MNFDYEITGSGVADSDRTHSMYVTIGDASKLLGVSIDTIRRWEACGKLHSLRLDGKNRHFLVTDIEDFKRQQPLSTSGVAHILDVSESTVRRLERTNVLVPERDENGRRLYSHAIVQAYITQKALRAVQAPLMSAPASFPTTDEPVTSQITEADKEICTLNAPVLSVAGDPASSLEDVPPFSSHDIDSEYPPNSAVKTSKDNQYTPRQAHASFSQGLSSKAESIKQNLQAKLNFDSDNYLTSASLLFFLLLIPLLYVSTSVPGRQQLGIFNNAEASAGKLDVNHPDNSATLSLPSTFFLQLPDSGLTLDITNQSIQGTGKASKSVHLPITSDQIAAGAVGTKQLSDGGIEWQDLSPSLQLLVTTKNNNRGPPVNISNFSTTNLSQTTVQSTTVLAGLGLSGSNNSNVLTLNLNEGTSTQLVNNNLEVRLSAGVATSTNSSGSGLESTASGLQLLGGCSNGQVLSWNGSAWVCATVNTSNSNLAVQAGGSTVSTNATALNFISNDFSVVNNTGQATIGIDYTNSGIARLNTNQAVTSNWSFTDSGFTIANANDATKQAQFDTSGVSSGTKRTLSVPNTDGTLITTGNLNSITAVGTIGSGVWQGSAVGVQYGGTGASSFANGGILYGNGTASLQATAAGNAGQLVVADGSGTPSFVNLSGDATLSSLGALTLAASGATAGTYGDGTHTPTVTVDSKGRITGVSNTIITGAAPTGSAAGDLTGNFPSPTIAKLQGNTLTIGSLVSGQILQYNGAAFVNQTLSGDITISNSGVATIGNGKVTNADLANSSISVTAGTGLSGGGSVSLGGSATLTLANTAVAAGAYGSSSLIPTFSVDAQGRLTAAGTTTLANTALQNSSVTVTAGTGLNGGGSAALGGSTSLSVAYGSSAGTAAQGNTAFTFNGSGNLTGSLSGTAGAGFTTTTLAVSNNPVFSTSVTTPQLTNAGDLSIGTTGAGHNLTLNSANSIVLSGFNCTGFANGGALTTDASGVLTCANNVGPAASTLTGTGNANRVALFNGTNSLTNSLLAQSGSALQLDSGSDLSLLGGNLSVTGNLTASGTITLSGLNSMGILHSNALGVLSTGAVALGSDTSGSYVTNLGTLTGLTTAGNSGAGSTPTLSVTYGSASSTAVQGNTTLICPSGTGNLSGGGTTVTLGSGGSCGNLSISNSPTFSGSLIAQGANVTVGASAQQGSVTLNDGNGASNKTATLQGVAALAQNTTYTLPDPGQATATICVSTGNCSAVGSAGGDLTGSYPNPTIAKLQNNTLTISGLSSGQILQYNGAAFVNQSVSGDITLSGSGVATIGSGKVTNTDLVNSAVSVTAGTGLSGGGSVALGASTSLAVQYGSAAGTAVQGNTTLTCASGTGNLSGGGGTITLGAGGSCGNLSIASNPSFTGLITSSSGTTGLALTGTPVAGSGITALLQVGSAIVGGNSSANGGTYIGLNAPASGAGSAADFLNFQVAGSSKLTVDNTGLINTLGGLSVNGTTVLTSTKVLQNLAGITSSGTITLSALNSAGIIHTNTSGVLSTSAVTLGSDTTGNYVATLGTLIGLSTTGNTGAGSTPTLSVAYGSGANTAVQGNTTLTCPSGTGNLSGGGTTITLGSGGSCGNLTIINSPTFSGTIAVQGASVTVGTSSQQGSLILNDGNGASNKTGTLQALATLGQNTTYTLPDPGAATATICLSNGNCSAVGGAGGDLSGSFPNPTIAKFQGTTVTLASVSSGQILQYNGAAFVNQSVSGDITINGSGVTALGSGKVSNTNLAAGTFTNITGTGALVAGSIASGFGTISTGNNITTSSALQGGSLSIASGAFAVNSSGALTAATGLTSAGTITLSGLSSAGIVHNSAAGVLSTSAVALGTDTSGSYVANLGTLTGLSTTGNSGAGSTPTLSVAYGSGANTAVQGNTTLTCPSGSGNLSGGGTSITLGTGGTCGGLTIVNNPSFSGLITGSSNTTGLALTGTPAASATSSLAQFGNAIAGGNSAANGGTYLGLNLPAAGAGSAADFLNFQTNGTSKFKVDNNGAVIFASGLTIQSGGASITGNSTIAGTLGSLTGLTSSGSITFSGLSSAGVVHNSAAGLLSTSAIALGTDTSGSYVANLGTLTGLSTTGNSGAGSSPTLSVAYGSGANTAVQGNTNLTCPSGSGNLSGGGTSITLGTGGTCGGLTIVNNPSFSGLITGSSNTTGLALTGTPAASATSSLAQFGNAISGGNAGANGGTYLGLNLPAAGAGSAADYLNFQTSNASKYKIDNTGAVTEANGLTVQNGGVSVTGNSTIAGTLGSLTGITSSGSITFSGLSSAGIVHNSAAGLLSTSAIALGTDTSGGYVANLGTLTGLSTTGNSGAGSTPTLSVTYGSLASQAVQGNTTLVCASGSGNLSGGGNTITLGSGGTCSGLSEISNPSYSGLVSANAGLTVIGGTASINAGASTSNTTIGNSTGTFTLASSTLNINAGAVSGITTLALSGAITGQTSTNTINGLVINSGALSSITNLSLSGNISGGTTYSGSSNINTTGGSLQTNSTDRIDNSGNHLNAGNWTATTGSTFTATGSYGFTFTSGTNNSGTLKVQNSSGQNVLSIDTTGLAGNLVTNASIESAIAGNWAAHNTAASASQTAAQSLYGANSLQVGSGSTAAGGAQQTLSSTLTASTQYNVLFYAKANAIAATPPVVKAVYSVDGTTESVACSNTLTLEYRSWQRYSCTFTTPAAGILAANAIFIEATTFGQTFFVDGVSVQLSSGASNNYQEGKVSIQGTIASPVIIQNSSDTTNALLVNNKDGGQIFNIDTGDYNNLVDNPSFETNTTGWTAVGTAPSIARDTSQQKFGLASEKVVSGTAVNGGTRYTLSSALATGNYTISFSMLTTSVGHNFVQVGYNNGAGDTFNTCTSATVSPAASATEPANVWVRYSCTAALTTPASILITSSVINKTFFVDAVQVETGSTATSYGLGQLSIGATIITPMHLKNQSDSTNAFQIQNASGTVLVNVDTSASTLTVSGSAASFASLTLTNAHFKSTQTTAPTIGTPSTCATTPTASVTASSTDSAGQITINSGSGIQTSTCTVIVSFNKAYGTAPKSVILSPAGGGFVNAANARVLNVTATSTTTFTVEITGAATVASTAYPMYYWVVE